MPLVKVALPLISIFVLMSLAVKVSGKSKHYIIETKDKYEGNKNKGTSKPSSNKDTTEATTSTSPMDKTTTSNPTGIISCPSEWKKHEGDDKDIGAAGSFKWVADIKLCGQYCEETRACKSFKYTPAEKLCNLNYITEPTDKLPKQPLDNENIFCSKPGEITCPIGWKRWHEGVIKGRGPVGYINYVESIIKCKSYCEDNQACKSFEYDPSSQECDLSLRKNPKDTVPASKKIFCEKPEDLIDLENTSCEIKEGGYFDGHNLGAAQDADTQEECAERCFEKIGCKFWAFGQYPEKNKTSCYIKPKLGPWVPDENWRVGNVACHNENL